jgi:hypothetical protein
MKRMIAVFAVLIGFSYTAFAQADIAWWSVDKCVCSFKIGFGASSGIHNGGSGDSVLTYSGFRVDELSFWKGALDYFAEGGAVGTKYSQQPCRIIENNTGLDSRVKQFMKGNGINVCTTAYYTDAGYIFVMNYTFDKYKTFGTVIITHEYI